jgi:hypothetical protein
MTPYQSLQCLNHLPSHSMAVHVDKTTSDTNTKEVQDVSKFREKTVIPVMFNVFSTKEGIPLGENLF